MRLYGLKELPKEKFLRYAKRYSPYGTVAAFYLWHIANPEVEIKAAR
jgi:3-methyladenine DNA glycosylase/8-oxoguanine DNA glycosylase